MIVSWSPIGLVGWYLIGWDLIVFPLIWLGSLIVFIKDLSAKNRKFSLVTIYYLAILPLIFLFARYIIENVLQQREGAVVWYSAGGSLQWWTLNMFLAIGEFYYIKVKLKNL